MALRTIAGSGQDCGHMYRSPAAAAIHSGRMQRDKFTATVIHSGLYM